MVKGKAIVSLSEVKGILGDNHDFFERIATGTNRTGSGNGNECALGHGKGNGRRNI